jgi:hypothetical protein
MPENPNNQERAILFKCSCFREKSFISDLLIESDTPALKKLSPS